jgi:hypothetical protein
LIGFLTCSAIYTTALSVLPLEVVHSVVLVEELSWSSSGAQHLTDDLSLEVSKALGVSLSEVWAQYFGGSDEVKGDWVLAEERDCY